MNGYEFSTGPYDFSILVTHKNWTDTSEEHIIYYPHKEECESDDNTRWYFYKYHYTEQTSERTDWILTDEEIQEMKEYIRKTLKPSELYEKRKEKDMSDYTNLNVAVPNEVAEELMSIISRYEGFKVPMNIQGDQNSSDEVERLTKELEQCEKDKKVIVDEMQNSRNSAGSLIASILDRIHGEIDYETYEYICSTFSENQIAEFGLERFKVEKKYQLVEMKVTKTIESYMKVITEIDEDGEEILSSYEGEVDFSNLFENDVDSTKYSYSEIRSTELTKEEARGMVNEAVVPRSIEDELYN